MPQVIIILIFPHHSERVITILACGQKYVMSQIWPTGRSLRTPGIDVFINILSISPDSL